MSVDQQWGRTCSFRVVLCCCAVCAVLGWVLAVASWSLLSLAYRSIELVWSPMGSSPLPGAIVLLICTAGGAAMGWWNHRFQSAPDSLPSVLAQVRETGSYAITRPFAALVSYLMPLACGGPVGPEAGLTGFVADGCTRIGCVLGKLRSSDAGGAGSFSRAQRVLVYGCGVIGAIFGSVMFIMFFGGASMPRLDAPSFSVESLAWVLPLTLVGMTLSWLYRRFCSLAVRVSAAYGDRDALRAAVCGMTIAIVSLALPYVLFPGTEQMEGLIDGWRAMTSLELLLTSVSKLALLALCLSMGWHGGPFFPLIFSAACCGLALAGAAGIDPEVAVIVVSTALIARHTRSVGLALIILLLCIPLRAIGWMVVPLAAGVFLPTVEELAASRKPAV